jgi:alkanesulfonate monooxygenase SsuD/methylene tetrahydromethanopterin reductase-like flavin-dependent oxidoreductase (luciferase family)
MTDEPMGRRRVVASNHARTPTDPAKLALGLHFPSWTTTSDVHWDEVLPVAEAAVDAGFDALYVPDHLLLPLSEAELKRRAGLNAPDEPDDEWEGFLECFTVLTALAVAVPRVRIGSLVTCTSYRNPALLAKIAATLDDVSGGRLVLGLGSGDSMGEHRMFGFPEDQPVRRLEEALGILKALFRGQAVDVATELHRLHGARLVPSPARPGGPPILIGTLNPRARMQRLVAQYADIWNGWLAYTDSSPAAAERQLRIIDDACRNHGRNPESLTATIAVACDMPGSGYTAGPGERPLEGTPREMATALRGHAALGIAEVQILLTMEGVRGVEAFRPVIAELRG